MSAFNEMNDATADRAARPEPQRWMVHRASRMTEGSDCHWAFLTKPADGGPERYTVEMNGEEIWSRVNDHKTTRNAYGEVNPNPIGHAAASIAEGLAVSADLKHLVGKLDELKFDMFGTHQNFEPDTNIFRTFIMFLRARIMDTEQAVAIAKVRREHEEEERRSAEARALYEKEKAEAMAAEEARKRKEAEEYERNRPAAIC